MQQGEGDDAAGAEGEPAGLRALEGAQGGRGHRLAGALGRRPARLAHRVLGDGRADARAPTSRSTAAAPTSSSRTTRTRSPRPRPRAASRWRGSGCTTGWCGWATRRWPSRSATSGCCTARSTSTAATRWSCTSSAATTASRSPSRPRRSTRPGGRSSACASCAAGSIPTRPDPEGLDGYVERFFDALADDFNTAGGARGAVRVGDRGQPPPRRAARRSAPGGWGRCCTRSGSRACSTADDEARPTRRPSGCSREREAARAAQRLRARRRDPRRAGRAGLGGARHADGDAGAA